ncbi:unnamed protein product [Discosporangium mesarthrocarpum]|jgi:hypothetical protein
MCDMREEEQNTKPEPERVYIPKTRACLRCRSEFESAWPGERICRRCKSSEDWRQGRLG